MINVVVAVSSKEGPYLTDWAEWYYAMGFSHILLYDACDDEKTFKAAMKYVWQGRMTFIPAIGKPIQWESYSNAFERLRKGKVDWAWVCDLDEFLVLKSHLDINSFLSQYTNPLVGSVSIPWSCYGADREANFQDVPVWKRFQSRVDYEGHHPHTRHVKSFVRPEAVEYVQDPHLFKLKMPYEMIDAKGKRIHSSEHKWNAIDDSHAQVNHYVTKSFEEWQWKADKGSADINHFKRPKRSTEDFMKAQEACTRHDPCALKYALKLQREGRLNDSRYSL